MNVFTTVSKYFHLLLGYEWCSKHGKSFDDDVFDRCIECDWERTPVTGGRK